jgi:hypothetical protein
MQGFGAAVAVTLDLDRRHPLDHSDRLTAPASETPPRTRRAARRGK